MGSSANVWILGGYQSDFARNFTRERRDFGELTAEVVDGTFAAANVSAADIGVVHVANAFGELFAGQGHLGAMPATVHADLWDTPSSRHEAACAQTRSWDVPDLVTGVGRDDEANPVVEGRLRRFDCSQMTDGGAGIVLVTDTYLLPHVRRAVLDAFDRARVTLDDLDGIEVHDCFTPSEYVAIDHIGLTGPGESWKAVENGEIEIGGRLPINPSGGLIGGGHPVGATGIRMLVDAANQVSDSAGDYQVEGARTFGTLNFGGSTATTVSFVVKGLPPRGR
jgi:acetyl-CoA C-acetyltransferase